MARLEPWKTFSLNSDWSLESYIIWDILGSQMAQLISKNPFILK